MKLRNKMSRELQEEIEKMSEEELLVSMQEIRNEELSHNGIGQWNAQYCSLIYSKEMLNERYTSIYEDEYTENPELIRNYEKIDDVKVGTYLEYVYVN